MRSKKYIIFDLDDTLFYELDYLKSAYNEIANILSPNDGNLYEEMLNKYNENLDVFGMLEKRYPGNKKSDLLKKYRQHIPNISLNKNALEVIKYCLYKNYKLGIITDGRSITQRNKIQKLGIEQYFNKIIISEEIGTCKPSIENYNPFLEDEIKDYFYIGDNISKDFITPNKMGWTTVALLDNGDNIHKQSFSYPVEYLPKYKIKDLKDLINIIN